MAAWLIAVTTLVMAAVTIYFTVVNGQFATDGLFQTLAIASALSYLVVGALLSIRNPGNRIGRLMQVFALIWTTAGLANQYLVYSVYTTVLPLTHLAAWIDVWGGIATLLFVPFIVLLFPTGTPPSRRWRPVAWGLGVSGVISVISVAFGPSTQQVTKKLASGRVVTKNLPNPFVRSSLAQILNMVGVIAILMFLGCSVAAIIALILRYRRSTGDEHQQMRWLAYVMLLALVCLAVGVPTAWWPFMIVSFVMIGIGVPVACAIAVLRYRLWDLDVVVTKAVVFTLVALFVTLLYAGAVALAAISKLGAIAGAVILVLTFNPVRRQARRAADRLVYGKRATPFEVMSEFSERVGNTYSIDDVLPRMAELVATSIGAEEARVWLRSGSSLNPVAGFPRGLPSAADLTMTGDELPAFPGGEDAFPVSHQGESLGALTLRMSAKDPMDPAKQRLVQSLAAQAGLALRNVRLVEDLRASRRRLVGAQDQERRRLERNIHDGAQQQLVALAVKIRLADAMVDRDPHKARELLAQLQNETSSALDDLRDLARGIYPPLLADKGLTSALTAQAARAATPTKVEANDLGRYAQDVESAVYFCVLEALQNVAKYANAANATVRLEGHNGLLTFEVIDDGDGFETGTTAYGTGIQGMADRLDAIGGSLHVESTPGSGTTVKGLLPASVSEMP